MTTQELYDEIVSARADTVLVAQAPSGKPIYYSGVDKVGVVLSDLEDAFVYRNMQCAKWAAEKLNPLARGNGLEFVPQFI